MPAALPARMGAGLLAALALILSLADHKQQQRASVTTRQASDMPPGKALTTRLHACVQLGEAALASPDCRVAWAEKRTRFFGAAAAGAR